MPQKYYNTRMDNTGENKKIILVVDDDDLLRGIYEAVFTEEGFRVLSAKDGQEAWEVLENGAIPDIVFTGVKMPRMDGFELIAKLRADPRFPALPVAISSHRGLPEDEEKARSLGVKEFIVQGTTPPREVVKRVKILLGLKSDFRIAMVPDRHDGRGLISFLNHLQGTACLPAAHEDTVLELEALPEKGAFTIRIRCEE